jgi:hypothetical protein
LKLFEKNGAPTIRRKSLKFENVFIAITFPFLISPGAASPGKIYS